MKALGCHLTTLFLLRSWTEVRISPSFQESGPFSHQADGQTISGWVDWLGSGLLTSSACWEEAPQSKNGKSGMMTGRWRTTIFKWPWKLLWTLSTWLHYLDAIITGVVLTLADTNRHGHTQLASSWASPGISDPGSLKSGQQASPHGLWTSAVTTRPLGVKSQLTIRDLYFHELSPASSIQLASQVCDTPPHIAESSPRLTEDMTFAEGAGGSSATRVSTA